MDAHAQIEHIRAGAHRRTDPAADRRSAQFVEGDLLGGEMARDFRLWTLEESRRKLSEKREIRHTRKPRRKARRRLEALVGPGGAVDPDSRDAHGASAGRDERQRIVA